MFLVTNRRYTPDNNDATNVLLLHNDWDDWFEFATTFRVIVVDQNRQFINVGLTKIGHFDQEAYRPHLPNSFITLDEHFFSLGQDENYYETLNELGPEIRDYVLHSLRDAAKDMDIFQRAYHERVMFRSLMRSVSKERIQGRLHRLAHGNAQLTPFSFSYHFPTSISAQKALQLNFDVQPQSLPPTNVHAIIGRNGVGKTHLLRNLSNTLISPDNSATFGTIEILDSGSSNSLFANVVSVTFSAFDPFEPLPEGSVSPEGIRHAYVGLKRNSSGKEDENVDSNDGDLPPKSPDELQHEFVESVANCRIGVRSERWRTALATLEADPLFQEAGVQTLSKESYENVWQEHANDIFRRLSSGHKIVLLTMTRLVELVDERTLVLLDEPEAHLHPPLLSAFVRALSILLHQRNGVAIVATHSPVVLQEVPSECVWILQRQGTLAHANRPKLETFGENVGVLTSEIFGLEVTKSGFHSLIAEETRKDEATYPEVLSKFNQKLGGEAKAITQALLNARRS